MRKSYSEAEQKELVQRYLELTKDMSGQDASRVLEIPNSTIRTFIDRWSDTPSKIEKPIRRRYNHEAKKNIMMAFIDSKMKGNSTESFIAETGIAKDTLYRFLNHYSDLLPPSYQEKLSEVMNRTVVRSSKKEPQLVNVVVPAPKTNKVVVMVGDADNIAQMIKAALQND